jgi:hypothetical protein
MDTPARVWWGRRVKCCVCGDERVFCVGDAGKTGCSSDREDSERSSEVSGSKLDG